MQKSMDAPGVRVALISIFLAATGLSAFPAAAEAEDDSGHEAESASEPVVRLDRQATWLFRSFLPDESDDANSLGLEFELSFDLGSYWGLDWGRNNATS